MSELLIAAAFVLAVDAGAGPQQSELAIWREFVHILKTDTLTVDRVRPVDPLTPASQLSLLRDFAKGAVWEEWEATPEVVRHGNLVSFFVTLGRTSKTPWTYTFNFLVEGDRWYYRFLEGIFLRLDKAPALPASGAEFPDIPDDRKSWIRQEVYWSQAVRLYTVMAGLKGKSAAANLFRDGAGYALAASTWVPFYPTPQAFVLYLCWEQAKLQGNTVILEKLTEHEAVVRIDNCLYFALYRQTSHLKTQISFEDYQGIFETIWQDRARAAGWKLMIDGQGQTLYLRFNR